MINPYRNQIRMLAGAAVCILVLATCLRTTYTLAVSKRSLLPQRYNRNPSVQRSPLKATAPLTPEVARIIGKVAFTSDRDGNAEIYSMDADGGGQTRLSENFAEDYSPAWSPDGMRLAFVSTRDGNPEIYVMQADGSGQTRLTNNSAGDLSPSWTPNGAQIAFVTNRDGNDEIYLMNPDGSNQTNLTNEPSDDSSFSFAPNGNMIAFSSSREDSQYQIYRMNIDGAGVVRLTTADGDDSSPSWSAQQISFQTNRDGNDEIYSMDIDGQNQNRLTSDPEFDIDPAQPSAGSRILFASSREGNFEIYIMNSDGSSLQRLTNNNAADIQPAIQPQAVIPPPPTAGAATLQFSANSYEVSESDPVATLTVTRTGNTGVATTVDFGTVNGSASNRTDYTYHFGTLGFGPGENSKTFTVLFTDDAFIEQDETLSITLSNPTGGALGSLNTATLIIRDNDSAQPAVNPIDNARFFVNQHYLDFLNRAPDPAGLDYWTNEITSCGNNLACLRARRNAVSAAFFVEAEFQESGFFVYRLYRASFGVLPTHRQFIVDRSRVVGGPTLESDKTALANNFVMRDEFRARYPDSLTPDEFVNLLFDTAALVPFTAERQQLADDMRNGKTRAQVLREVIEIAEFRAREYNTAFVLMQYFGYLGRDPEPEGFAFWLDVVNNREPNNYRGMVCAFITSAEYQLRFSSIVTQNNAQCASVR